METTEQNTVPPPPVQPSNHGPEIPVITIDSDVELVDAPDDDGDDNLEDPTWTLADYSASDMSD